MQRSALLLAIPLAGVLAVAAHAKAPVSCDFSGHGGENLTHGIVVPSYNGNNVRSVGLGFSVDVTGVYGVRLTVRRGSFAGPLVGAPAVVYFTQTASTIAVQQVFDFAGAPVTPGDALALTLERVQGTGNVFFDAGTGNCVFGFAYDTQTKTPPLDSERGTVGIGIIANDQITSCIASDTVACLNDAPGDHRFKVSGHFATVQGGGKSGNMQAITTSAFGVDTGAMFWFFDARNPEILVKVVDGCALNQKFWVFYSATTNVGFTLDVTDTVSGVHKAYINADVHAATPVEDVVALPCTNGPS